MNDFMVAGLINQETTVRVDGFPLAYSAVHYPFHGVNSTISGVGFNVAKALHTLGHGVHFASLVGDDWVGQTAIAAWRTLGGDTTYLLPELPATPQSAILYDPDGRRQIHVDLKTIQETAYPVEMAERALRDCQLAVVCNINFARPILAQARAMGVPIATDVHTLSNFDDDYNRDFMAHADILFLSNEHLPTNPAETIRALWERYAAPLIVVGMGAEGAMLGVREHDTVQHYPAVQVRPIVNTIGAGDALFAAFVHGYLHLHDPYKALRQAMVFAAHKIGATGAAEGFLSATELQQLVLNC